MGGCPEVAGDTCRLARDGATVGLCKQLVAVPPEGLEVYVSHRDRAEPPAACRVLEVGVAVRGGDHDELPRHRRSHPTECHAGPIPLARDLVLDGFDLASLETG